MKLELVNFFSFSINVSLSFSFLPQKGSLMKTFFRSSRRKFGIKLSDDGNQPKTFGLNIF